MVLMHVLNGLPGSHAYAMVYGQQLSKATCEANASRVLGSARVQQRKAELLAAKVAREPVGVPFLVGEALAVAHEARALGQGSAAIQAYQLIAKLHGLLVDRVQQDVLIRKPSASPDSPDDMAAEDWLSQYAVTPQLPEPDSEPDDNT
jgi:hypothetical protein